MILHGITAMGLALAWTCAIASAGDDGHAAKSIDPATDLFAILYALAALAGICVVAFKNAKRTHLD